LAQGAASPKVKPVPEASLRRLPSYLHLLRRLHAGGRELVSCTHIAESLDLNPTQVRKDLAYTGIVGRPRIGYPIRALIASVEHFLGWDNTTDAFLVGAGSLGRALLGYAGFQRYNLNIVAAFDVDPERIGTHWRGKPILDVDELPDLAGRMHVHLGVLTVPADAAQDAAHLLVLSGLKAIWNFTGVALEVPREVLVEDVDLGASLAVLSNRLAQRLRSAEEEESERHVGGHGA